MDRRVDEKWLWAAVAFLAGALAAVAAVDRLRPPERAPLASGQTPAGGRPTDTLPDPKSKPDPNAPPDPRSRPDPKAKPDPRAGADPKR